MVKKCRFLLMILPLLLLFGCTGEPEVRADSLSYYNHHYIFPDPIMSNLADPFILAASDGYYYLYGTSTNRNGIFASWRSLDLINWEPLGIVFSYEPGSWAYTNFWAPEVLERDGQFYLFFTARERGTNRLHIGLATSNSPAGPFVDARGGPLLGLDFANIDGSPFIDDDGRIFLYFSRDCSENIVSGLHRSDIYVIELDEYFNPISDPMFLLSPTQRWELANVQPGWRWVEAPSVIQIDGKYFMTYSANPYWSFEYAIGVATSTSPTGPFVKYVNNPIVRGNMEQGISGPGHNSIFTSHDGMRTYIAYHVHTHPLIGGGSRRVLISQVEFIEGTMRLVHRNY